jgi:basic membrane protein A
VMLLAYQSDMVRYAPHAQLAAVTHHWGGYYTEVAAAVLANAWRPQAVWGGMKDGLVQLSAVNPALPAAVRTELAQRQRAIVDGRFKPFAAPLVDNQGRVRLAQGALADEQIATMDWLVQGVSGSLPATK